MRLCVLVCLLSFALPSPAHADDRRRNPSRLSFMTLNANYLWDGALPEMGKVDFPWKGSPSEALAHMEHIAELIIRADADMVNLVEVENADALALFNATFLAGRGYKPYLVLGTDTYSGRNVGLLTRVDPDGGVLKRDAQPGTSGATSHLADKHYWATFSIGTQQIAVIGVQFSDHPLREDRRWVRQAEADVIRRIALERRREGFKLIIAGDFNDFDGSADSLDLSNSVPITSVLSDLRALDPSTPADDLVNAAAFAPQRTRATLFTDINDDGLVSQIDKLSSVDHVLVSRELGDAVTAVDLPHAHDPVKITRHFPVIVSFMIRAQASTTATANRLRIARLLPNPEGDESVNESAVMFNEGSAPIDLSGWRLRDLRKDTWTLRGTLAPGASLTVARNGQPMSMENQGDTIDLVDPGGLIVQSVTYGPVSEGEWIYAGIVR